MSARSFSWKWFGRLLTLFLVVTTTELILLLWIGKQVGFWPTAALIVGTALAGSFLAQREGMAAWRRFSSETSGGHMPGAALTDGLLILVASVLLLTPGVLTDVVGFALLIPPSRAVVRRLITKRFKRAVSAGTIKVFGAPMGFGGPGTPASKPPPNEDGTGLVEEPVPPRSTA